MNTPLVLLFNAGAGSFRAARLHSPDCRMTDHSGLRLIRVEGAELERTIADLHQRGFEVRECTCLAKPRATDSPSD